MINPAQIPTEAVEAAVNAYAGAIWDADAKPLDYRHAMTAAIAAALNAWPGAVLDSYPLGTGKGALVKRYLDLPLPQEKA